MSTTIKKTNIYGMTNPFSQFMVLQNASASMGELYNIVTSEGLWKKLKNWFSHSDEAITSIRVYPLHSNILLKYPLVVGQTIGGSKWKNLYYRNIEPLIVTKVGVPYVIPAPTSFIDLSPHTQIQLYLPYIDFIDIPVNEVIGNIMQLYYSIDFSSGTATAYVEVTKGGVQYIIATKTGKIGIDVAYGRTNGTENLKNIVNTAISTAVSLYTINASNVNEALKIAGKVSTITKAGMSATNSLELRYQRGGLAGSCGGTVAPNHPYLIIKKQKIIPVDEEMYAHTYGKPLYESRVLSQIHGFTILDEIHLTGFGTATDSEITEIERLLKTGVIL